MNTTAVADQRPALTTGAWIVIAVCTLVVSVPADLFIHVVFMSSCSQPADPGDVLTGRIALHPAIAFTVHGLTAGAWTSSLCLGG